MHLAHMMQGALSCYFTQVKRGEGGNIEQYGSHDSRDHAALPTLLALERTIAQRKSAAESGVGGTLQSVPCVCIQPRSIMFVPAANGADSERYRWQYCQTC